MLLMPKTRQLSLYLGLVLFFGTVSFCTIWFIFSLSFCDLFLTSESIIPGAIALTLIPKSASCSATLSVRDLILDLDEEEGFISGCEIV